MDLRLFSTNGNTSDTLLTHRSLNTQGKTAAASCLLAGLMLSAVSDLKAYTLFEFGIEREDATITEGYAGDIEQLAEPASDLLLEASGQALHQPLSQQLNRGQIQAEDISSAELDQADLENRSSLHRHNNRVWIVSIGSSIYSDADRDGFFSNFSISFDADTVNLHENVYARILLREGDQEYQLFHTSQTFDLYSYSASDTYRVEGNLVSNYPAAYYDVQVDLFDAYDGSLLDSVNASTHRTLSALPLESLDNVGAFTSNSSNPNALADATNPSSPDFDGASGVPNQIVREHAGSSFLILPMLLLLLLVRRIERWKGTT